MDGMKRTRITKRTIERLRVWLAEHDAELALHGTSMVVAAARASQDLSDYSDGVLVRILPALLSKRVRQWPGDGLWEREGLAMRWEGRMANVHVGEQALTGKMWERMKRWLREDFVRERVLDGKGVPLYELTRELQRRGGRWHVNAVRNGALSVGYAVRGKDAAGLVCSPAVCTVDIIAKLALDEGLRLCGAKDVIQQATEIEMPYRPLRVALAAAGYRTEGEPARIYCKATPARPETSNGEANNV